MTPQQLRALDFIRDRVSETGYAPTVRELADHVHAGVSAAHALIDALVEQGHLVRHAGQHRGLSLPGADLRHVGSSALRAELSRRGETLEGLGARQIAHGTQRTCAADTCGAPVAVGHLFCRSHWYAIPATLRSAIFEAHRRRQSGLYQQLVAQARDIADGCTGVRVA